MSDSRKGESAFHAMTTQHGYRTVVPLPTEAELEDFYANTYFQQIPTATYQHRYSAEHLAHKRLRADLLVHVALQQLRSPAPDRSLLDVGFGEGFELLAAQNIGLPSRGVDFSLEGLRRCNPELETIVEAGDPIRALRGFVAAGVRFDICVLKNVLEHVREPETVLNLVGKILRSGGIAVVTVPNDYSPFQAELLSRGAADSEYWFSPPQHLQYFNAENFPRLAAASGFEVADVVGDFPIELYLLHPGSNYVRDRANGPAAHDARVAVDLFLARQGLHRYADICRSLAAAGMSRTITVYLRPAVR